jgi:predicted CXXCH cytochrome family protein
MKMKKRRIGTALAGLGLVLGLFSNAAFAATTNTQSPNNPTQPGTGTAAPYNVGTVQEFQGNLTHDSTNSATVNSNQTGQGVDQDDGSKVQQVIKADKGGSDSTQQMLNNTGTAGTQRTHGEYQNNTDSCASCHQTHTASGETLLFKDGVYNTCTACHDGTLGFYNVFQNGKQASTAGTFGGTTTGNMSAHLATGALQIKAAPGGNPNGTGSWTGEFDCASCHAPHGSYSDRLLNYNPNNMGNSTQDQGGIKAVGLVYDLSTLPTTQPNDPISSKPANYITVRATWGDISSKGYSSKANNNTIQSGDTVVLVYKWNGTAYVPNAGVPLIYGSDYGTPYKGWYTRLYKSNNGWTIPSLYSSTDAPNVIDPNTSNPNSTGVNFDYADGYIWATAGSAGATTLAAAQSASMAQAYIVKFDLVKVADFGGVPIYYNNEAALNGSALDTNGTIGSLPNTDPTKLAWSDSKTHSKGSGMGVALNKYCVACHTDYFSTNATALSGTFSQNYRHVTNSDSYTCVRCHFAHGTDVQVMKDAQGNTINDLTATGGKFQGDTATATRYMLDQNPDSALKRYTNMAVCWGCHTSSHADQFKNNSYYWNGAAAGTNPAGLTDTQTPTQLYNAGKLPYGNPTAPTNVADNGTGVYAK